MKSIRTSPRRRLCALALLVGIASGGLSTTAEAAAYPNDPYYARQWHLRRIGAPAAWKVTKGKGVTIAVVDTGVDRGHPDLTRNLSPLMYDAYHDRVGQQMDACPSNPGQKLRFCHGTFVAGVAGAIGNNRLGVIGVAPDAKIMTIQASDPGSQGIREDAAAAGIMWAADHGAKVINLSFGGVVTTLDMPILYATARGALVVAASGNEGLPACSSPGTDPLVLCVGASDRLDAVANFSNYGLRIDVVAPGTGIWSTCKDPLSGRRTFCAADGTSFAAPIVAGIAAQLMSMGASNLEAANIIRSTSKDLGLPGYDYTYGFGRVDAAAAVNLCKQIC